MWLPGCIVGNTTFSPDVIRQMLAVEELLVFPMVVLELQYLFEIGRTTEPAETVVSYLRGRIGLQVCDKPFDKVILPALAYDWTRDPFDRIIVAQAALDDSSLKDCKFYVAGKVNALHLLALQAADQNGYAISTVAAVID